MARLVYVNNMTGKTVNFAWDVCVICIVTAGVMNFNKLSDVHFCLHLTVLFYADFIHCLQHHFVF